MKQIVHKIQVNTVKFNLWVIFLCNGNLKLDILNYNCIMWISTNYTIDFSLIRFSLIRSFSLVLDIPTEFQLLNGNQSFKFTYFRMAVLNSAYTTLNNWILETLMNFSEY